MPNTATVPVAIRKELGAGRTRYPNPADSLSGIKEKTFFNPRSELAPVMRAINAAFFLLGCTISIATQIGCNDERGISRPLTKTDPDTGPRFRFDPSRPFRLEFGRGSGWHGLETTTIEPSGATQLHRGEGGPWEVGSLSLDQTALSETARTIVENNLPEMERAYHGDVADGTQWVFWLRQDKQSKSIYFNNYFPQSIQNFAETLDRELARCGMARVEWKRVDPGKDRDHEKSLWESIR